MLNMTKVELELVSDADIFILWKKYETEFLTCLRDIVKPTKSVWNLMTQNKNQNIIYLDANNLFGYAMSKFLPTSGLKLIYSKDFDSNKCRTNSSTGCALDVVLEYPKE